MPYIYYSMSIRLILYILISYLCFNLYSQPIDCNNHNFVYMRIENGDTILYDYMREVIIFPVRTFRNEKERKQYTRLIRDVKKVYPYAKLAGQILLQMGEDYNKLHTEIERKMFTKKMEDRLRFEFEEELKKLTIRQGILLMKLIDRETGQTTYDIVKELRGRFSVVFWQALARLFGSDMKVRYDPLGEDKMIEEIVILIENGLL